MAALVSPLLGRLVIPRQPCAACRGSASSRGMRWRIIFFRRRFLPTRRRATRSSFGWRSPTAPRGGRPAFRSGALSTWSWSRPRAEVRLDGVTSIPIHTIAAVREQLASSPWHGSTVFVMSATAKAAGPTRCEIGWTVAEAEEAVRKARSLLAREARGVAAQGKRVAPPPRVYVWSSCDGAVRTRRCPTSRRRAVPVESVPGRLWPPGR